jgi:hypothetical protein
LGKLLYDLLNPLWGYIRLIEFGINGYQDKVLSGLLPVDHPVSGTLALSDILVPDSDFK